jgi:heterodisulfide reductase subunit C
MISNVVFGVILVTAVFLFVRRAKQISKNINLGKDDVNRENSPQRFKNMFRVAFGQQKMFARPIPAFLHLMVYVGFLVVNVELLEIIIDGLFGTHRIFSAIFGNLYVPLINTFEFFAFLVIVSCVVFLIRRNIIRLARFRKPEMQKWPTLDANLILIFEIVLMFFLFSMNATDTLIQQKQGNMVSGFFFSNWFTGLYQNASLQSLQLAERFYWWAHILGIFFFANYVLLSKHLHIFLAFPATYFANLGAKGQMQNMEAVTKEVKIMLGMEQPEANASTEIARFGAKDVEDLSWKHLLNAYSCTECGRCTSQCPANLTGKKLSPRKIMMDVRDRVEELGKYKAKNGSDSHDGLSLADGYITEEELFACTTCNACTEACPINLNPLEIIMDLRRFKAMEESKGPAEWMSVYQNLETNFSPWKMPVQDRFKWASES